ncbi:unnamed protein product [Lampetra fluviatilis]
MSMDELARRVVESRRRGGGVGRGPRSESPPRRAPVARTEAAFGVSTPRNGIFWCRSRATARARRALHPRATAVFYVPGSGRRELVCPVGCSFCRTG